MNKCQNNLHKNICTKKFYVSHFVVAVDNKQFPYEKQRVGVWACERVSVVRVGVALLAFVVASEFINWSDA